MYHPMFKGNHYDIGLKFGKNLKKQEINFDEFIHLNEFQEEFGRKSQVILSRVFPEVCDEIRGITHGLGYSYEKFASWLLCMGCCYEPKGCTSFCFTHNGGVYYGRNNDLPPFLKRVSKSILYKLENGHSFIGNTSSMVNFEEGLNEYGLAVAMEFILPTMIQPGFNSVFLVRYLLEKCASTKDAVKALQGIPIASACSIILADKKGEMVVAECTPEKTIFRKPQKGENFIVATNHFVSVEMRAINSNSMYSSELRYQTACNALTNIEYIDGIEHAKAILSGRHGFICQYHKSLNFVTIWSSVFDITNNMFFRAEGDPSRVGFKEDIRTKELFSEEEIRPSL